MPCCRRIDQKNPTPTTGAYAELVDENDPDSPVQICKPDGTVELVMSRELYEQALAEPPPDLPGLKRGAR